jgi:hypothetical protein
MKIFIIYGSQVSSNYHTGGGLVVIAENEEKAKELLLPHTEIQISNDEWKRSESFDLKDENTEAKFWVMPDAGCC